MEYYKFLQSDTDCNLELLNKLHPKDEDQWPNHHKLQHQENEFVPQCRVKSTYTVLHNDDFHVYQESHLPTLTSNYPLLDIDLNFYIQTTNNYIHIGQELSDAI